MDKKNTILIVDDTPENIDILREFLGWYYDVKVANNGEVALKIVDKGGVDIILLDIMMPGMGGYEVCKRLKSNNATKGIPIIFISSLEELENKTKGFELGAIDYITKPFEIVEVKERVKTHLELIKAKNQSVELLSKTLSGTVELLLDMLSLFNLTAFNFSNRVKTLMTKMVKKLNLKNSWQYLVAAMLSQIGCLSIPTDILKKIYELDDTEENYNNLFLEHPKLGAKIIGHIPRLEGVAKIIERQLDENLSEEIVDEELEKGIILLNLIVNYLKIYNKEKNIEFALKELNKRQIKDVDYIRVLRDIVYEESDNITKDKSIESLEIGDVLEENLYNSDGKIVMEKGSKINQLIKTHLLLLSKMGTIKNNVKVQIEDKI